MADPLYQPPATDEVEVSLFGPGYGEAALVHIGQNEWLAIDSCLDGSVVAPLQYLNGLGVDIGTAVSTMVVSHWHDDHIRGFDRFFQQARSAALFYPAALGGKEFLALADLLYTKDRNPVSRETNEIYGTLNRFISEGRLGGAALGDTLLRRTATAEAFSLSPSNKDYNRFIANVAKLMPTASPPQTRRRIGALSPNDTAMVVQIKTNVGPILLGSDLEEEDGAQGWSTLLGTSRAILDRNVILKVPHHGSKNAHHQPVWDDYRSDDCIAILTPFVLGDVSLPTTDDVSRIGGLSAQSYITTLPRRPSALRRDNEVSRALRQDKIQLRPVHPRAGHIRLRRSPRDQKWQVEFFNGAKPLAEAA